MGQGDSHLSTFVQVSLVTNDQHWKFVSIFHSEHLKIIIMSYVET